MHRSAGQAWLRRDHKSQLRVAAGELRALGNCSRRRNKILFRRNAIIRKMNRVTVDHHVVLIKHSNKSYQLERVHWKPFRLTPCRPHGLTPPGVGSSAATSGVGFRSATQRGRAPMGRRAEGAGRRKFKSATTCATNQGRRSVQRALESCASTRLSAARSPTASRMRSSRRGASTTGAPSRELSEKMLAIILRSPEGASRRDGDVLDDTPASGLKNGSEIF